MCVCHVRCDVLSYMCDMVLRIKQVFKIGSGQLPYIATDKTVSQYCLF